MIHFSEIPPESLIEEPDHGERENYLWEKSPDMDFYFPDITTYRIDPWPENFRELQDEAASEDWKTQQATDRWMN